MGEREVTLPQFYAQDLARLDTMARRRGLALPRGRDFSSNDYLALAGSDALRDAAMRALERGVPMGSGGSRLLRGHRAEHARVEEDAARFFGSEAALFMSTGFAANSLLFSTLPQKEDCIFHDALIHASAHEGMRLSRAERRGFAHNDVDAAADAIAQWRASGGSGTPWIAFETLYSMDGDIAPVAEFAALARAVGAMLFIDEAHAVGVYGPQGRGLASGLQGEEHAIVLATCGKALGCEGALVLCSDVIRDFLINRGRGFIFSTAPSPLMAAVVGDALRLIAGGDDLRQRLRTRVQGAADRFAALGIVLSGSQIQPVVIGEEARTMEIAAALQAEGFDIRGIRPPTVPEGTARLRLSITLNSDEEDMDALIQAMERLL
ncbi:8-amino-7-oxononanoate synthase [uncultured Croceicoccus sp.]|uniref:8-amino-7-oxononanoate synthase n=1 Tax=uncultured Croceicoccus sp. TaxID=1295329 RepID=UPI00262DE0C6|nr:8-amino-7-oxononanoate synthase [uncultured Croceicoccus sp.]